MQNDFLKELEYLGITARLKRVSDSLSYNIRALYEAEGLDIEPGWHLVFLILEKHGTLTMTELADAFELSQPAATKMISRMKSKGYVNIQPGGTDGRKKHLVLSEKAMNELPRFRTVWDAGQLSVRDMLRGNDEFLTALEKFEQELKNKSFKARALDHLKG